MLIVFMIFLVAGWLAGCVHLNFVKRTGTGYIRSSRQRHSSTAAEMGEVASVFSIDMKTRIRQMCRRCIRLIYSLAQSVI